MPAVATVRCTVPQITCFMANKGPPKRANSLQFPKLNALKSNSSSRPEWHQPSLLNSLAPALASAILLAMPTPEYALAENVRVEDVESNTLRAGLEAANEGRLDAAERFFKTYIAQEDPNSASGYSNLGNVHLQQGRTQQALEDFTKAVELAPNAPVPRLNRSIAYEQLGVDAEAERGNKAAAAEFFKKAIADCDAAIAADPKEFAAYFDRGNVQMRVGDFDGALQSFEAAADTAPGLAGYRLRAATLEFQTGDLKKAKQTLRGITRKYRNYAEARAVLAAVEWSEGDREGAEEELAAALDLDLLWGDETEVKKNTRWPPKLYDAYSRLLQVKP